MDDFSHLLNWTLLDGSHDFPGPDGGTCVNEAAIVAAGFAYQRVGRAADLPACFCPVVGAFSVWLNDRIVDRDRRNRLLLPFVTRLAGTRGSAKDERLRLEILRARLRDLCPERHRRRRFSPAHEAHLLLGELIGPLVSRRFTLATAADARELLEIADHLLERRGAEARGAFLEGLAEALEAMLRVGPAPSPLDYGLVVDRMKTIKAAAPGLARA